MSSIAVSKWSKPTSERACGSCTLCCKVMAIAELDKPQGAWCGHCRPGVGCRAYDSRPAECRSFTCAWLVDQRLGPEWKPDRCKMVLTIARDGNGLEIRCDPKFPHAWRQEPYRARILEWAEGAKRDNGSVVVLVGDRMTLISPEGEFYLGPFSEGATIVREYSGGRLINAHLQKVTPPDVAPSR